MTQTLPHNPGFDVEDNVVPLQHAAPSIAAEALTIALRALSQRALIALAGLFSLALAGSVFALYWKVLPDPSPNSLIGLGLYAVFALTMIYLRYRK